MKTVVKDNFRVEIYPRISAWNREVNKVTEEQVCNVIEKQVRKHVDDVGTVGVFCDRKFVCSHCGSHWTEKSETYNGGCCDEDEKSNPDFIKQ